MIFDENNQNLGNETPSSNIQIDKQTTLVYAGFWRRLAASLIDGAITSTIGIVVGITFALTGNVTMKPLSDWLSLIIFWLYFAFMESSSRQATLGKVVLGIKVIDVGGGRISFLRATGRNFAKFLSILILGIGFLMAGFTRKKQALHDKVASCFVVTYGKSYFWRVVFVTFASFVILVAGIGAYVYYIKWPQWKQNFITTVKVVSEPIKISDVKPLPEKIVSVPKGPVSLTEADYDKLLSTQIQEFEKGVTSNLGPVAIELSKFWDYNKQDPNVWIKVMAVPLPNLNFGSNRIKIVINHVWNKNGKDVYNPTSSWETETFQFFSLSEENSPVPHLRGTRSVHLLPEATENSIQKIDGQLVFMLPIEIKTLTFDANDIGKEKRAGTNHITLKAIEGGQILVRYKGIGENYLTTRAYNAEGQELENSFRVWFAGKQLLDKDFKDLYEGVVEKVDVLVASQTVEREYPFVLEK